MENIAGEKDRESGEERELEIHSCISSAKPGTLCKFETKYRESVNVPS